MSDDPEEIEHSEVLPDHSVLWIIDLLGIRIRVPRTGCRLLHLRLGVAAVHSSTSGAGG